MCMDEKGRRAELRPAASSGVVGAFAEGDALIGCGRAPERRLSLVSTLGRVEDVALARADRGSLLASLGRWQEARVELEAAAALVREPADPRWSARSAVARAAVHLATGELASARSALER